MSYFEFLLEQLETIELEIVWGGGGSPSICHSHLQPERRFGERHFLCPKEKPKLNVRYRFDFMCPVHYTTVTNKCTQKTEVRS